MGGLLKVGVGVATSADPLTAATPSDEFVAAQVFEQLTAITGTGEVAPLLATGWSSSAGGRVWVFNLRPDVRFHDDRPFEAADVVATFDPLTTGATSPEVATKFGNIVTVLALDTAHVEFFLRAPDPLFPQLVADPLTSIRPRPTTEGAAPLPIGTGPFALRSFSTRDRAVLVRNAAYWRDDATGHHLPYLDEVQVFFGPDVGALVAALQGGELQLVMALPPALAATVARDPLLALLIGPGGFAGVDVGMTGIVLAEPWQRTSLASARFVESTKKP
jgi:peptide/nickel transport system substrate-binding protein